MDVKDNTGWVDMQQNEKTKTRHRKNIMEEKNPSGKAPQMR